MKELIVSFCQVVNLGIDKRDFILKQVQQIEINQECQENKNEQNDANDNI